MTIIVTFNESRNMVRMTIWNVVSITDSEKELHIFIADRPDKNIPKEQIKSIRINP